MQLLAPVLLLLSVPVLSAQQPPVPVTSSDSVEAWKDSPFRRLDWPAPNDIRTGAGGPGQGYWQQRVDYLIRESLDRVAQRVRG